MQLPQLHRLVIQSDAPAVARLLSARRVDIDALDATGRSALMYAAQDPNIDPKVVDVLLQHAADVGQKSRGEYHAGRTAIGFAVAGGDPRKVAALIDAGASIRYCDDAGYTALLDAVHHRDVARDTRLLALLQLLISHQVELNTITPYQESGLRVLSRLGRFDAIGLLLEAGAEFAQLQWTALHRATALGSWEQMRQLLEAGHCAEDKDWWERTPWLLAIVGGDTAKVQLLQDYGADTRVHGRCGTPPLSFAVLGGHPQMLRYLLAAGGDVQQTDDFGATPLFAACEHDQLECAAILLAAGANIDHRNHIPQTALGCTQSAAMTRLLLDAGADIRELSKESRRGLLGFPATPDLTALAAVSIDQFTHGRTRRFGRSNPEVFDDAFWHAMICSGVSGYSATQTFDGPSSCKAGPVWCADRFGQSITFLLDGRIVQVAGEHEDGYDPDFCIYNDVFVHEPAGRVTIYGYPESLFPPTDFHTATVLGRHIYLVGSLGYQGTRRYGFTPVYSLDTDTFVIEAITCAGAAPGWIYGHAAKVRSAHEIEISCGTIVTSTSGVEQHAANQQAFVLDVSTRVWRRL